MLTIDRVCQLVLRTTEANPDFSFTAIKCFWSGATSIAEARAQLRNWWHVIYATWHTRLTPDCGTNVLATWYTHVIYTPHGRNREQRRGNSKNIATYIVYTIRYYKMSSYDTTLSTSLRSRLFQPHATRNFPESSIYFLYSPIVFEFNNGARNAEFLRGLWLMPVLIS